MYFFVRQMSNSPSPPIILTFVTGNENKRKEVAAILAAAGSPVQVVARKLDLPELQGASTQHIARQKCWHAAKLLAKEQQSLTTLGPVIIEDTALCFTALNGLPGPYIKWFLDSVGHDGLNRMLNGFSTRAATALCTFAYCPAGIDISAASDIVDDKSGGVGDGMAKIELFEGRTEGEIVAARGPTDFGWDPIFQPVEGGGLTYAEMAKQDKNKISHRSRALHLLCNHLM